MDDNTANRNVIYPVELLRPREYSLSQLPSPPQQSQANPAKRQIVTHLIQLAQKHYHAVSTRDFSSTSAVWQDKAPWWKAEIGILSDHGLNLANYVEQWKTLAIQYPGFAVSFCGPTILDVATVEVNSRAGIAEMYVTAEITGMPEGLTRAFVGVISWKKIDGEWMSTKFRTLPGGLDS